MGSTHITAEGLERLDAALDAIRTAPETWAQSYWATRYEDRACGTALCLAGHIVNQAGYKMVFTGGSFRTNLCRRPGEDVVAIFNTAMGLLGLDVADDRDRYEGMMLFEGSHNLDDLEFLVKAAHNGDDLTDHTEEMFDRHMARIGAEE